MQVAIVGLGKMGANMARRLCRTGHQVIGHNRSTDIVRELAETEGMIAAPQLADVIRLLTPPRVVWLMLPAGDATETMLQQLRTQLARGDIVVDGGNANYHDSQRRGQGLAQQGIGFIDAGTSGGVWGLENGYCLMVGGEPRDVQIITPLLQSLAPDPTIGWGHVGPVGAGHFTKMIHNGIEYGMMQAYAEGLALLQGKTAFDLDLAQITELWRHGSVVRSWLLDLTADFLAHDQQLHTITPIVPDSGEGRWTVMESIDQGVAAPVISLALQMRFSSQAKDNYAHKLLAMMRNAFGGHALKGK
ncbi:MAG: decarboxylating 6-phosphogluconate dehydrogenase [Gammaproteobacteria bacterium]|nr:decarboxylating 6-phosphogluconate dehydrogenase [Gammaproteobacteria bacterium]